MKTVQPLRHLFEAMACPCEVLLDTDDAALARQWSAVAEAEAHRIEAKFSRYKSGNIIDRINTSNGAAIEVDGETALLLDFAETGHRLSEGLFDITTGALRRAWRFHPDQPFPPDHAVREALANVGWGRVKWEKPFLTLEPGMEIDLGGIAKEYAVDRALALVLQQARIPVLINFGGDIVAHGPQRNGHPWVVGVEDANQENAVERIIHLQKGGLTTSGDSKRFILHNGRRYGHILDPRTGYPVLNAPRSVTVAADSCTQAGFLSTLGMLKGNEAEIFLKDSGVRFWIHR